MLNSGNRCKDWGFAMAVAALITGCASASAGAPTMFVYRLTAMRVATGSCAAESGDDRLAEAREAYFFVQDLGPFARARSCETVELCTTGAEGAAPPVGYTPEWTATIASFVFEEDKTPGFPGCRGRSITVRSSAIGAPNVAIEVSFRALEGIARDENGVCSADHAASVAPSVPCIETRRYEGRQVAAW